MVRNVQADLEQLNVLRRDLARKAESAGDAGTSNLLSRYADDQEKTAWMQRAFLSA